MIWILDTREIRSRGLDIAPRITDARVRPFVDAILLFRGAVRCEEVVASLIPHVNPDDLRIYGEEQEGLPAHDSTGLEVCVTETLQELVDVGILRHRADGLYVVTTSSAAVARMISVAAATNSQLPDHLLNDLDSLRYYPSPPL
jgi:hypothetical protein